MTSKINPMTTTFATYVPPPFPFKHLPVLQEADVPKTVLLQTLYHALSMRRDSGTQTESRFVAWLVNRLPVTMIDCAGNVHVDNTAGKSKTLFTAHTDTVHHGGGHNVILNDGNIWRSDEGSCLGADDGAGVALMVHMLHYGVPGYYIFFRGEECGGVGSSWLAKNPAAILGLQRCISFDRADQSDVITHQAGGRCCSDTFAEALAEALTTDAMWFLPDSTGVFTDSANLTEIIPECTNLSVGYKHQHGDHEYQDIGFLQGLAAALVTVDWEALPTKRDPKEKEYPVHRGTTYPIWDKQTLAKWGSGGMAPVKEENDIDAAIESALMDALDGKHAPLRILLAEWLDPQDPNGAERYIDVRKLKYKTLERYLDQYLCGMYDFESLLDELVTKATIV